VQEKKKKKTPTMKKIIWMVKKRFTIHMNSDNSKNNAKKIKIFHVNSAKKEKELQKMENKFHYSCENA